MSRVVHAARALGRAHALFQRTAAATWQTNGHVADKRVGLFVLSRAMHRELRLSRPAAAGICQRRTCDKVSHLPMHPSTVTLHHVNVPAVGSPIINTIKHTSLRQKCLQSHVSCKMPRAYFSACQAPAEACCLL